MPVEPGKFLLYWAAGFVLFIVVLFRRPRPKGMRLRLGIGGPGRSPEAPAEPSSAVARTSPPAPAPSGERPLNVVFNYNGHSWDAYEVLGLPAGSNLESARAAFTESLDAVDATSKPFIEAAFRAIQKQWDAYRG